jgi:hypothetical protein
VRRQEERDAVLVKPLLEGLAPRQTQLCFLMLQPALGGKDALMRLTDEDLLEASRSLAATYRTAASGLIYEHRPKSYGGSRLFDEMKRLLAEAGISSSRELERDAVEVLERIGKAVTECGRLEEGPTAMLEALGRMQRAAEGSARVESRAPRLDGPQGLIVRP